MCTEAVVSDPDRRSGVHDFWVIFEIPTKDSSEREDRDMLSALSLSLSDFSLDISQDSLQDSMCLTKRQGRRSACKRIDAESPLHRSHFLSSLTDFSEDDESTASSYVSRESKLQSNMARDRWAPCPVVAGSKMRPTLRRNESQSARLCSLRETCTDELAAKSDLCPRRPRRYVPED